MGVNRELRRTMFLLSAGGQLRLAVYYGENRSGMIVSDAQIRDIVRNYERGARVKDGPFVLIDPNDLFILLKLAEQHPRESFYDDKAKYGEGVKLK